MSSEEKTVLKLYSNFHLLDYCTCPLMSWCLLQLDYAFMLRNWLYTVLLLVWDTWYCTAASAARSAPPVTNYRMIRLSKISYVNGLNMYGGYYLAVQELIIFLIVVVLLSAAKAQLHKILAIVAAPRYAFGVEASKQERKVRLWELDGGMLQSALIGCPPQAVPHLVLLLPCLLRALRPLALSSRMLRLVPPWSQPTHWPSAHIGAFSASLPLSAHSWGAFSLPLCVLGGAVLL